MISFLDTDDGLPEEVGGVKVSDMPGPEALNMPGRRDGQTKMIKDGNTISVHNWSELEGVRFRFWSLIS